MNERILELEDQCWVKVPCDFDMNAGGLSTIRTVFDRKKFAELIVRECMKESWDEIVSDEDIAQEDDPLIREYLKGNNQGIVDAVIRFRNHFGVEE